MKRVTTLMAGLLIVGFGTSVAWSADGKALYDKSCASCHGAAGKGDGAAAKAMKNKPADLSGAAVKGMSDADIAKFIKEGKAGTTHPKAKLSDEEAAAVAKYVKSL
jgi:mono/diheme cytochrome c family protein